MYPSSARSIKSWATRLGTFVPRDRADDPALLAAIARGDRQSMELLYRRHASSLRWVANVMLGFATEAEDLLHDVYCEAYAKAGSYEPARGSVATWLLMRLRSRALDYLKSPRVKRAVSLGDEHLNGAQFATEDNPATHYLTLVLRRNLAALPRSRRQLLYLIFYGDLNQPQVADQLRLPLGTVKSRLARTLQQLRGDLPERPPAPRPARLPRRPAARLDTVICTEV